MNRTKLIVFAVTLLGHSVQACVFVGVKVCVNVRMCVSMFVSVLVCMLTVFHTHNRYVICSCNKTY